MMNIYFYVHIIILISYIIRFLNQRKIVYIINVLISSKLLLIVIRMDVSSSIIMKLYYMEVKQNQNHLVNKDHTIVCIGMSLLFPRPKLQGLYTMTIY